MSDDSGTTWAERGGEFGGTLRDLAVVAGDARSVYALIEERVPDGERSVRLTIAFSADAGATWEERSVRRVGLGGFTDWPTSAIAPVRGQSAPAAALTLSTRPGYPGSGVHSDVTFSGDGGRTFQPVGSRGLGLDVDLVATSAGIARRNLRGVPTTTSDAPYAYSLTTDGGVTWQPLALPYPPEPDADSVVRLEVAPTVSSLVFLTSRRPHKFFAATDGGLTWRRLADYRGAILVSPATPRTLLGLMDGELFTLTLDLAGLAA